MKNRQYQEIRESELDGSDRDQIKRTRRYHHYHRDRRLAHVGDILENAIHESESWKENQAQINKLEAKWAERRRQEREDKEAGRLMIVKWEIRFGPRHQRRAEREKAELKREKAFNSFWAERRNNPPPVFENNGRKTMVPPIVHKDDEEAWLSFMQIVQTAFYLSYRLHYSIGAMLVEEVVNGARA